MCSARISECRPGRQLARVRSLSITPVRQSGHANSHVFAPCLALFFIAFLYFCYFVMSRTRIYLFTPVTDFAIASHSTTSKMNLLSQIIYSCKTFYIFRTIFPSIITSSKLRLQQWYMSNSCCYLLLSGMRSLIAAGSSSCLTYTVVVGAVLSS
jgi:hypothetical protein